MGKQLDRAVGPELDMAKIASNLVEPQPTWSGAQMPMRQFQPVHRSGAWATRPGPRQAASNERLR